MKKQLITLLLLGGAIVGNAQTFTHYVTTPQQSFKKVKNVSASRKGSANFQVSTNASQPIVTFKNWGTTFNELDWIALNRLRLEEREEIMQRAFDPNGELRFTMGRISMNANDYADGWYQCDSVPGDFKLKYFNIERDKKNIIPYTKMALKYQPDIVFWMSPWSPPAWMKINHDYPVQSNKWNKMDPRQDYLLFGDGDRSDNEQMKPDKRRFPRRLAVQDYFIQDPRYLQAYANMFCRFIDLYHEQGIDFKMVMYQNEAYSYTPYPGCPWTPEGIIRFNADYLAPTLKKNHPEVKLYLGTFNTNRYDHVNDLLNNEKLAKNVVGLAFQWEGGQIMPRIHKERPQYELIASESECGNGNMDWRAAAHTFNLINHYVANGCANYTNWNLVLCDRGQSPWGWRQNALVRVNSKDNTYEYRPEWFTYRHYSQFIRPGSKIIGAKEAGREGLPVLVAVNPQGKYVIVAANWSQEPQTVSVDLRKGKRLTITLEPQSMNSFVEK